MAVLDTNVQRTLHVIQPLAPNARESSIGRNVIWMTRSAEVVFDDLLLSAFNADSATFALDALAPDTVVFTYVRSAAIVTVCAAY
jgi:hypothetical protein